jgi:hypothetical protein
MPVCESGKHAFLDSPSPTAKPLDPSPQSASHPPTNSAPYLARLRPRLLDNVSDQHVQEESSDQHAPQNSPRLLRRHNVHAEYRRRAQHGESDVDGHLGQGADVLALLDSRVGLLDCCVGLLDCSVCLVEAGHCV